MTNFVDLYFPDNTYQALTIKTMANHFLHSIQHDPQYPDLLYHYTTAGSLKKIIESREMFATHIAFLNDAREYFEAIESLVRRIWFRLNREGINESDREFLSVLFRSLQQTDLHNLYPFFVLCFSEKRDSLAQWRSYGRGEGGISIGFCAQRLSAFSETHSARLVKVIYEVNRITDLCDRYIGMALTAFKKTTPDLNKIKDTEYMARWINTLFQETSILAVMVKNSAFYEEMEWRVIFRISEMSDIQFREKPEYLSPFIKIKLLEDRTPETCPLRSVQIGPGRYQRLSLLSMDRYLQSQGMNFVKCEGTAAPFRNM
jgi:Protein of unknown function (DUF2971)